MVAILSNGGFGGYLFDRLPEAMKAVNNSDRQLEAVNGR